VSRAVARRKRLRRALRAFAETASSAFFAAAARRRPGSRTGRLLNRAGATVDSRLRRLERSIRVRSEPDAAAEHEQLVAVRWRHRREVREPLVLISQIHRSGGTLLMRLFDGHPQLHVLPHELGALLPQRDIPLDAAAGWRLLADAKLPRRFLRGLKQAGSELNRDEDVFPFMLPPLLQRRLFERMLASGIPSERAVLDAYLTSYFNAWLDYGGLAGDGKRFVVGFEPQALVDRQRMQRLFELYPDGRLVSLVRDPWSWFVSARRWDQRYAVIGPALDAWSASTHAALALERVAPERVRLVLFEALVRRTEPTMRALADWLGIRFDDVLLAPTFNGAPIGANSSFPSRGGSVSDEPATQRRRLLSEEEERIIGERAGALYEDVAERCGADRSLPAA
jgi:Sulfotransferase family